MRDINQITGQIVNVAYRVHSALGPGLLESVYESVMQRRLEAIGIPVERQKKVTFSFEGIRFDEGLKVDLLVDGLVVVELKSVEKLARVHPKQLLTYLRLMNLPIGLLINFGAESLNDGIRRVANTRAPSAQNAMVPGNINPIPSAFTRLPAHHEAHAESSELSVNCSSTDHSDDSA
jgi:GxxExxY protein